MKANEYVILTEKLKVLAHPHRLFVVKTLIDNACNVKKLQECVGISQSCVSQHLSKLKAAGIVEGTRTGSEICYKVIDKKIIKIMSFLI
jgi:ArsR family transcriptional regulator